MSLAHLKNVLKHYVVLLEVYKRFRMSFSYLFRLKFVIFRYGKYLRFKRILNERQDNSGKVVNTWLTKCGR